LIARKSLRPILLALIFFTAIMSTRVTSFVPILTQPNSELEPTIVYLDPPTINGTVVDEGFVININIHAPYGIGYWQAGMTFNATLLECTGFVEGEFLKSVGGTLWLPGTIDNTNGVISAHSCNFLGSFNATGDGRLAYLTFRVKALGVSNLHLRDVIVGVLMTGAQVHVIDVFTVVLDTTPYTVVIASNTTGQIGTQHSVFFDHTFSLPDKELSFKVTQPSPLFPIRSGFANVTIPKALLSPELSYGWAVIIDGNRLSTADRTVTENATHTSFYFKYGPGTHTVQITTRFLSSTISIALSPTVIALETNVTISGDIDPPRPAVNVTILYRTSGGTWGTLVTRTTDSNSSYSYEWTPETTGTYEIKASWDGDSNTLDDESNVQILEVIPKELVTSLDSPDIVRPGESFLINVTVHNFGPDETDVELQLLINGSLVNSTVIPFLERDSNYTLNVLWTAPGVEATYNLTAYAPSLPNENVTINNAATKFIVVKSMFIDVNPDSGPIGTKATITGWYYPQTQVGVTFNDMLVGYAMTNEDGDFTFVFNVPVSVAGVQTVTAFDAKDASIHAENIFTVLDVTPLEIEIGVGTIHFRGESADFYIQTAFKGKAVNATSINAELYGPNNETAYYQSPENITWIAGARAGFYKVTYSIPLNASTGTYSLVIEASYTKTTIDAYGTSFKNFLLSPTLTIFNATLVSLNGTAAWVKTEIGVIKTDIATIGLNVAEINGDIVTLQTTLGTIEGKITSIEGDIATIETDVGTVQADISKVIGAQEAFATPLYAAVVLSLIAAVGAVFIMFLRRKAAP